VINPADIWLHYVTAPTLVGSVIGSELATRAAKGKDKLVPFQVAGGMIGTFLAPLRVAGMRAPTLWPAFLAGALGAGLFGSVAGRFLKLEKEPLSIVIGMGALLGDGLAYLWFSQG
jgi:hypothetical protein